MFIDIDYLSWIVIDTITPKMRQSAAKPHYFIYNHFVKLCINKKVAFCGSVYSFVMINVCIRSE